MVSFGIFSDNHYADLDTVDNLVYRDSDDKLTDAVADWNGDESIDFVIELGDFVTGTG